MKTLHLRKQSKSLYQPSAKAPEIVDVPDLLFLIVENGRLDLSKPEDWSWRAMITQPDLVTREMFEDALAKLRKKRPSP